MTASSISMLEPHTPPFVDAPPHAIGGGEGVTVWGSTGQEYLDAMSGVVCTDLGYSQPRLVQAGARQMEKLPFYVSMSHCTNDVALALADDLARLSPIAMGRRFFASLGAEAVDSAIKLSWYYHRCRGREARHHGDDRPVARRLSRCVDQGVTDERDSGHLGGLT